MANTNDLVNQVNRMRDIAAQLITLTDEVYAFRLWWDDNKDTLVAGSTWSDLKSGSNDLIESETGLLLTEDLEPFLTLFQPGLSAFMGAAAVTTRDYRGYLTAVEATD